MSWIMNNLGTIVGALLLAGAVAGIVAVMRRDRKKGKSCCGGNCSCCQMGGSCHKK